MDTSTYTHLCRAGHAWIIESLAPGGVILIPDEVNTEIENGRTNYPRIPAVAEVPWAETTVLTEEESFTLLMLKAERGGTDPLKDLGECAVIACAQHRGHVAVIDERKAVDQARERGVPVIDTLWIIIEAYKVLFDRDKQRAAEVIDDLIETGMRLPISSGESLMAWAYEEGLLP